MKNKKDLPIQIEDNKWYHFAREEWIICCDCSLVHRVKFKVENGKIYAKWTRSPKDTYSFRRSKKVRKHIKTIAKSLKV